MKLSLGYSGPWVGTFLIFCAYWPSYNILVDIIFFRKTGKFLDSDSSFRSHHLQHSSICQSRNILLSFTCKKLKSPLNFQVRPEIDLPSSLQFYLIFNKKWSFLDSGCRGSRRLSPQENLVYSSHHYFGPHGFCSSPRASAASSVCTASCSKYGICNHHWLCEVPAASASIFIMISPTTSASPWKVPSYFVIWSKANPQYWTHAWYH